MTKKEAKRLPKLVVFFSWQSDEYLSANKKLIHEGLDLSRKEVSTLCDLEIDQAIRNKSGSPNIPQTIFAKIDAADIFLCDLSRVGFSKKKRHKRPRSYFNANVAIELGYAIRTLGWERIVLVCNEALGTPEDTPFDVRSHALTRYRLAENAKGKKTSQKQRAVEVQKLSKAFSATIIDVAERKPLKAIETGTITPDKLRRTNDLKQLDALFEGFSCKDFDSFFFHLGYPYITHAGIRMHESFSKRLHSSATFVNDKSLRKLLRDFGKSWGDCFKYFGEMELYPTGKYYWFRYILDMPQSDEQEAQADFVANQRTPLEESFGRLKKYIQEHFPDFNFKN